MIDIPATRIKMFAVEVLVLFGKFYSRNYFFFFLIICKKNFRRAELILDVYRENVTVLHIHNQRNVWVIVIY